MESHYTELGKRLLHTGSSVFVIPYSAKCTMGDVAETSVTNCDSSLLNDKA